MFIQVSNIFLKFANTRRIIDIWIEKISLMKMLFLDHEWIEDFLRERCF